MAGKTPSLADVDAWFEKQIIPKRTAWSGLSPNRFYKTPHRLVTGNQSDPNGPCGDTTLYVFDAYDATFKTAVWTTDGYQLGAILWEGLVLDHIANVMLPKAAARQQTFVRVGDWPMPRPTDGPQRNQAQLGGKELLGLHVYDLYYKKRTTVAVWWLERDDGRGEVTVGLQADFA